MGIGMGKGESPAKSNTYAEMISCAYILVLAYGRRFTYLAMDKVMASV